MSLHWQFFVGSYFNYISIPFVNSFYPHVTPLLICDPCVTPVDNVIIFLAQNLGIKKVCSDDWTWTKMQKNAFCQVKLNSKYVLFFKMIYFCCVSLGGNQYFLDFVQKTFTTLTTDPVLRKCKVWFLLLFGANFCNEDDNNAVIVSLVARDGATQKLAANTVTRFCEISPIWQNFKPLRQVFEGLVGDGQKNLPTFANLLYYLTNFQCC